MAKKAAKGEKFNLSKAVREALETHPKCTGAECLDIVKKQYPNADINPKTLAVTWSKQRGKKGGQKTKVMRKPGRQAPINVVGNGVVSALDAAMMLVKAAGGTAQAQAILSKLEEMQVPF